MRKQTKDLIDKVKTYLETHGPVVADNRYQAARQIGVSSYHLHRVVTIVRSPEWIDQHHWTIPFVSKGIGPKTYAVASLRAPVDALVAGNKTKTSEVETHMRRNLAGLQLEASFATGQQKRKAQILAVATESALKMIDLARP